MKITLLTLWFIPIYHPEFSLLMAGKASGIKNVSHNLLFIYALAIHSSQSTWAVLCAIFVSGLASNGGRRWFGCIFQPTIPPSRPLQFFPFCSAETFNIQTALQVQVGIVGTICLLPGMFVQAGWRRTSFHFILILMRYSTSHPLFAARFHR